MNAPLSRYLTRFAAEAAVATEPSPAPEPTISLTVADLDARLAAARDSVRVELETAHAAGLADRAAAHEAELAAAIVAARADWCEGAAGDLAALVDRAFATLQGDLATSIAKVLRPLLAEVARERALAALEAVLARLLADPLQPAVTVRAPADLVAALRARALPPGVALVAADVPEALVTCGGTRVETRLAAALSEIAKG